MLSIIIVNFKNPPLLRLCLKSLTEILNPGFDREIIVVDVATSVETRNVARSFNDVKLSSFKDNIGFTKGVNEGIKNSKGNFVLLLNADLIPLKDSIEGMYRYMVEHPGIGVLGPKLLNFDGSHQKSCFRLPSPMTITYRRTFLGRLPFGKKRISKFLMDDHDPSGIIKADWLFGSPIMINKKAIEKVGLMDERFFLYMSDVDWLRRFWENRFEVVYYPGSVMYHYHSRHSSGKYGVFDAVLNKETRWHIIDAIKYFRKHGFSTQLSR